MRRPRGDDGAMAVFICILLVVVLLPATALGLTAYTRSAVQAEKARSADSGALAGAAALVLLDVSEIPTNPLASLSTEGVAFAKATLACNKAAARDNELSLGYATSVSCTAKYSPDTGFAACADDLLNVIPAPVPLVIPLPPVPVPVPGGLPPIPGPVPVPTPVLPPLPTGGGTIDVRRAVKSLVPALLHNGVTVTLRYKVRGPLDEILRTKVAADRTAVATARRRFKPLLPPGLNVSNVTTLDPSGVYAALATVLTTLEQAVEMEPRPLPVPIPISLPPVVTQLSASCRPAAAEVIRDLRDALKPNPFETDLLTCFSQKVLRVPPPNFVAELSDLCASKVFRAQLAPDV